MKSLHSLFVALLTLATAGQSMVHAQLLTSSKTFNITGVEDLNYEVFFIRTVKANREDSKTIFNVSTEIRVHREYGAFLIASTNRIDFPKATQIGSESATFTIFAGEDFWDIGVLHYY